MSKEKLIIQKLFKIAQNQQKILLKLSQDADPGVTYLKQAAQIAAKSLGYTLTKIDVSKSEGTSGTLPGDRGLIVTEANYRLDIEGIPANNKIRQRYIDTLTNMAKKQKPEVGDNLSINFLD